MSAPREDQDTFLVLLTIHGLPFPSDLSLLIRYNLRDNQTLILLNPKMVVVACSKHFDDEGGGEDNNVTGGKKSLRGNDDDDNVVVPFFTALR